MRCLALPGDLRMELREFFMRRRALYHRRQQVELLEDMSPALQGRVARWVQDSLLKKIWFFRQTNSDGFLVGLFQQFHFRVYPPKELVHLPHSIVIQLEGMCLRGTKLQFPGDLWGVAELLLNDGRLHDDYTPLALSYSELQYLTRHSFQQLL